MCGMLQTPQSHQPATDPIDPRTERRFRPDIQGLRAIAVLTVALCHAGVPFLPGGYVGVDVFFVISGFLITGWLLRRAEKSGRIKFGEFYGARARRILPAATLTLVVTVCAAWHYLNYVRAVSVIHDAIWATFFAANIHFAEIGANYFATDDPPSPLQNFWTLAVEEQFYIVWPALLAVSLVLLRGRGRRLPHEVVLRRLAVIVGACVLASFAYSVRDTSTDQVHAYFSTLARGWELGVGALVAVCTPQLKRLPERLCAAFTWIGLGGILLASVWYTSTTKFPGYAALLPVLATALVLIGGLACAPRGGAEVLLRLRPMRITGDCSYAFYLWHWPILIITAEYVGHALPVWQNLLLLVVGFGVSLVTYHYFENPIRHMKRLQMPRPALALWPITVSMVVVTGLLASSVAVEAKAITHAPIVAKPLPKYTAAVAASVTPNRMAMPIPKVLNPSIPQISHDGPKGCVRLGGLGKRCTLGAVHAKRRMIVFGDSHAAAWMPSLAYYARTRRWALTPVVRAGCTIGVASATGDCRTWYRHALQRIRTLHPGFVVIAQYYDPRIPVEDMYNGMAAEVAAIKKIVPRVVVIEDPPRHPAINPIDCLLKPGATLGSCTLIYPHELATEHSTIRRLTLSQGALYLPTLKWFCYDGKCPIVVGHTVAYWDTDHMTTTYSRAIAVPVSAALQATLGR